jgi:hypothetical protein
MSTEPTPDRQPPDGKVLRIAAIQMDANPAPTADRLACADRLVAEAAAAGAELVALPELFNTGYSYSSENHSLVEPIDGRTATWMCDLAARLKIHLAGSLMLLDGKDVFNALLLFAPDGRMWRYDKNYPWGCERGSFRGPRQRPAVTVAETDLGAIGMMICWDAAHLNLWTCYAGRVDFMLICSSPPDVGSATYCFPDGSAVTPDDMGPMVIPARESALQTFGEVIDRQTAWLGVPAVNTVHCGDVRMAIPAGRLTLLGWATVAPWLLKYISQADRMVMHAEMVHQCKVLDARGQALTRLSKEDGESFALAEVWLPASRPAPQRPQPPSPIARIAYFISDTFLPAITKSMYRQGQRRWRSGMKE